MAGKLPTSLRLPGLQLDVRNGVTLCEREIAGSAIFYLTLLDDEIDDRFERFLIAGGLSSASVTAAVDVVISSAAPELELTDAIICSIKGNTTILRGSSCAFPLFWAAHSGTVHLATHLPILNGGKFSKSGFCSAITLAALRGPYEANAFSETPLDGWRRVRRGTITVFSGPMLCSELKINLDKERTHPIINECYIVDNLRAAFAAYGQSQRHVRTSVVELSGGFDSTLAAAAAVSEGNAMHGVSIEFPYYEFRFESELQGVVGKALGIPRTAIDGMELFPYTPPRQMPRFDEPAIFVTGIRHSEVVGEFAAARGASRIYVGHGGDQLFATDLSCSETVTYQLADGMFLRTARCAVQKSMLEIRNSLWLQRQTGCWIYDSRQDAWVKETYGATIRTPFTDLSVFRAALLWSRWNRLRNIRPDKSIFAEALPHLLPSAVVQRKGKVAYDGVWMRARAKNADHVANVIDRVATVLEHIGLSPSWLMKRVRQLAAWKDVSEREVMAAYAVAFWLSSWGLERLSDLEWA
jgi:hypothetical protein